MTHTSSLVRLIDTSRMHLPSALEGAMRLELFNVLKAFLQRTDVWQDEITVDAEPSTYDYPIAGNQTGAFINRLIWLEGPRSDPTIPESGSPVAGILMTPGVGQETLRVASPPNTNETWYAHVALTPADPTDSDGIPFVPEWILDKYHHVLLEGLLERMMTHPAKPYSNAQGAMLHGRRFQSGMSQARAEVAHKFTFGGNSWRFPRTYRSRSQRR